MRARDRLRGAEPESEDERHIRYQDGPMGRGVARRSLCTGASEDVSVTFDTDGRAVEKLYRRFDRSDVDPSWWEAFCEPARRVRPF